MLIKPLLIAALETALNHYLGLDANKDALLMPLKGKVIALTIQPFNETVYLCPTSDAIQIIDQTVNQPDTLISGSLWALGLMGVSAKPMRTVFSGDVSITGDMHTGKQFQELFKKLDIDLEKLLAQYAGNNLASQIGQWFRTSQDWGKETIESFKLNTAEFLQEETRDLPANSEIDLFYQAVDELRNAADRIECRVERLNQHLNPTQE